MTKPVRLLLQSLEPREAPAADLSMGTIEVDKFGAAAVPGELGFVTVTVINNDSEKASAGKGGIHVALKMGDDPDILIGKLQNVNLGIPASGSRSFIVPVRIPALDFDAPMEPGDYLIHAAVIYPGDDDHGNNEAFGPTVPVAFKFGDTNGEREVLLGESSGKQYRFGIQGNGTGELDSEFNMTLTGTDRATVATVIAPTTAPAISLRNVTVNGALKVIQMSRVNVRGQLLVPGGLTFLKLNDLGGELLSKVDIGPGNGKPVNLAFNRIDDSDVIVASGVNQLTTGEWLDDNGDADALVTPFVNILRVDGRNGLSGDMKADVRVTGVRPNTKVSLNRAFIAGVLGGDWDVFADVMLIDTAQTAFWTFDGGQGPGSPGTTIHRLGIGSDFNGDVRTTGLGQVLIVGDLTVGTELETTGAAPIKLLLLGLFHGTGVVKGTIVAPGGIDVLVARKWEGATLAAGRIKRLVIDGDAADGTFNLNGGAAVFLAETMTDCVINAAGQAFGMFVVRGSRFAERPYFSRTTVTAGNMGIVRLSNVNEATGEPAYGITADAVLSYSRLANGRVAATASFAFDPDTLDQAGSYSLTIV